MADKLYDGGLRLFGLCLSTLGVLLALRAVLTML